MIRAKVLAHTGFVRGRVRPELFGSFVEHIGRAVYGGIHEPGHPTADDEGFRQDVLALVRELGVTRVRYPGGNFVSGFRWEDSVGPAADRPRRRDLAWHSIETNEVGLHEFASWARKAGLELLYALNLGTRDTQAALDLLDYANGEAGSALADRRIANGATEPFGIRTWYLGNEMDGRWQLGHLTAEEYGRKAARTASAMRQYDPGLTLVAAGSSHESMRTFGDWERTVLLEAYRDVDQISCHAYYEEQDGDLGSFLASAVHMDRYVQAVVTSADHVKTLLRSDKTIHLSFDEWNVWYLHQGLKAEGLYRSDDIAGDDWPVGPRVAEDDYDVADAVVVGNLLMTILRNSDRIASASLSMLVNAMAPIRTEPGGDAWRQTTFHPFALTAAHARGDVLDTRVSVADYETALHGSVPLVDVLVTHDEAQQRMVLLIVNRSAADEASVTVALGGFAADAVAESWTIADDDLKATNSAADPDRVGPRPNDTAAVVDPSTIRVRVPAVSWSVVVLRGRDAPSFAD